MMLTARTMARTCSPRRASLLALILVCGLAAAGCGDDNKKPTTLDPGRPDCERDNSSEPADAGDLTLAEAITGFICPLEDKDWYRVSVPASDKIVKVALAMSASLSPVEPTYAMYALDGSGAPTTVVASPPATEIGAQLNFVHCVGPGEYLLVVRDDGDNAQDTRRGYSLTVSSQPDPDTNEPNDAEEAATALAGGASVQAAIACRGDQDWYVLDVPADTLLRMVLTAPIVAYEPTLKLFDGAGNQLVVEVSASGTIKETNIDRFEVLPGAGRYYLSVSDNDDADADPDQTYTLRVEFVSDTDPNEPNNHPREATPLSGSSLSCGSGWSSWIEMVGTIGSPGDNDWFAVPMAGCNRGVIEAEMRMGASSWEFNAEVQATLALVREHTETPCQTDSNCTSLNIACENSWDCAGYFNSCLPDGLCAGAAVCLPGDVCGATQVQRRYECNPSVSECQQSSGAAPPTNIARLSAPLYGDDVVYLRASDFQSDGSAPETPYTLRVRVRSDPDSHEPSNLYAHTTVGVEIPINQQPQSTVTVHDCTTGDCCGSGTWETGVLSYEGDWDWYNYVHPCPGTDCTMRLVYDTDAGPVDYVIDVYTGGTSDSLWYSALDLDEAPSQAAQSGALGGRTAADSCFYAYQGHGSTDFRYHIAVRDRQSLYPDTTIPRPESRDWSSDQTYRFCLEKIDNVCLEPPCQLYENGCGPPQ